MQVTLTKLRKINNPKGDLYHVLKSSELEYSGFGEAYFTSIHHKEIKGWKRHNRMTLNLVVPFGDVKFYIRCSNNDRMYTYVIGDSNYQRLTVPPGYWVAFEGVANNTSLILNIANIEHDINESDNLSINPSDFYDK